jgi:hypothetical protein
MKLLCVLLFALVTCSFASAQTAEETKTWIENFCAGHTDCINPATNTDVAKGLYLFEKGQVDWISQTYPKDEYDLYDLSTATSITIWIQGGASFIRLVAQEKRCFRSSHNCAGYVGTFTGTADIRLQDQANKEDTQRLLNALIHLAELAGAKPNLKEPF